MLKLQFFGHLMPQANSLEKTLMLAKTEHRRRGRQRMRQLNSITNSTDMNLTKLQKIEASLVALMVKNLPTVWETMVLSLSQEDPQRRKWQPTPIYLPGEFCGQRTLVDYSP